MLRVLLALCLLATSAQADVIQLVRRGVLKPYTLPPPRWDPQNYNISVPGTFCAWWTARDHNTFRMIDSGGGAITAWTDRISGITVTATSTPTWAGNLLIFNGASGTGNVMSTTVYPTIPVGANPSEIWATVSQDVQPPSTEGAARWIYNQGTNAAGQLRALVRSGSDALTYQINAGAAFLVGPANTFVGAHVIQAGFAAGTMYGSIDAVGFGPQNQVIATAGPPATMVFGASAGATANFWKGSITDIVITCRQLTATEVTQLYNYLASTTALGVVKIGPPP